MKAVILAGGEGRRLRPYSLVLPKPLMPLGDEPILVHLLDRLEAHGILDIVLAVGPLFPLIESYFNIRPRKRQRIEYLRESRPLSTVGPLSLLRDSLKETFLVVNGDTYTDLDFTEMARAHRSSGAVVTVAACVRDHRIDYGVIREEGGRIRGFEEKPVKTFLTAMGANLLEPAALNLVPDGQPFGFDQLMLRAIAEGRDVRTYVHRGFWFDIGREEDYRLAQDHFERERSR